MGSAIPTRAGKAGKAVKPPKDLLLIRRNQQPLEE
jgi:hypothetical protein